MIEDQKTINAWQRQHFPNATSEGVLQHLREELVEFYLTGDAHETAMEAADLIIVLYHWALVNNVDLHAAIDAKMKINRSRSWNIQPDGTGRHQKGHQ